MIKHKKRTKLIIQHLLIFVVIFLYVIVYRKCLIREILHIPCPTCGMTRAYYSLIHLKLANAFRYHPLFWLLPPAIMIYFHHNLFKIPKKWADVMIIVVSVITFAVYIYRLTKNLVPIDIPYGQYVINLIYFLK